VGFSEKFKASQRDNVSYADTHVCGSASLCSTVMISADCRCCPQDALRRGEAPGR
jgi:hypothetical protein